jgi:hypothetical protein
MRVTQRVGRVPVISVQVLPAFWLRQRRPSVVPT